MTKVYIKRILECVELMIRDGSEPSVEAFERKYNLPRISEDNLNSESDEALKRIADAVSEKSPIYRTYIQTGARSKMVNIIPTQVGHGNLNGDRNKTREIINEENCCMSLEKSKIEIKYLKRLLEDRDIEMSKKDVLISELMNKIT